MHEQHLRRAVQIAVENAACGRGGPFGAVIVKDGEVIAEGANHVTTLNDPTAHAEVVAIREACGKYGRFDLRGAVIYASCEPCPMCLAAIYWARLDALYFAATREDAGAAGFDDSFLYDQVPLPPQKRSLPSFQLDFPDRAAPFRAWKGNASKIRY